MFYFLLLLVYLCYLGLQHSCTYSLVRLLLSMYIYIQVWVFYVWLVSTILWSNILTCFFRPRIKWIILALLGLGADIFLSIALLCFYLLFCSGYHLLCCCLSLLDFMIWMVFFLLYCFHWWRSLGDYIYIFLQFSFGHWSYYCLDYFC